MIDVDGMRAAWREERTPSLARRRKIAAMCAVGLADFAVISLYQMGVLRHMPDPPGKVFDSDKVNAAHKAYMFGAPDGPLGALFYAALMSACAFGGTRKTGRPKALSWAVGGLAVGGVASALDYLRDMLFVEKRACPWCIVGAGLNLAIAPLAAREVKDALAAAR